MVTINDIAKMAGVAKSTVSRYLNGGSISKKTKAKLDAIVAETGYTPNTFAQSLKAKRTNIVGTIIPRLDSYSSNSVLEGIDQELLKRQMQLVIMNSSQSVEREIENIYALGRQKADAIILFGGVITDAHMAAIKKVNIPVVVLGQAVEGVHSLVHDEAHAGESMGRYITASGHQRILLLSVTADDQAIGQLRRQAILDGLSTVDSEYLEEKEVSFVFEESYQQIKTILPQTKATAIICATDTIALAVMKAAHELGYQIPKDFSLAGFGGYSAANIVTPAITTVRYPYQALGKQAVETVVQLLAGKDVPIQQVMANDLIIQESTRAITAD